jgi:hypothetical protein
MGALRALKMKKSRPPPVSAVSGGGRLDFMTRQKP